MVKHQEEHPALDVDGCFACRIAHVNMAPSATPTRGGGAQAAHVDALERQWDKDLPAYARLRKDGYQPERIDGSHHLEAVATSKAQIESPLGAFA